ncbi:MAG: hypothetical protein DI616_05450 [Paracoccus denitrificans]|uniref:Uncharacterized protein n=1 Tax=Paracoccus denitrificans TaxID=266 RepID=A0A533IDR7_PARDE|nr:MAG: hypothetical protein DI616_05450 [Paracoccus denitrificans]
MRYRCGAEARVGDRVMWGRRPGVVVFSIDSDEFSDAFPNSDWAYLGSGVMIDAEGVGLVHEHGPEHDGPDIELIARAK